MKYIKTFESYSNVEKIDENLKSVISGALLGLSTLISPPMSGSLLDPSNPIGLTNPISPLNPLNNDESDELSSYDIHKVELLKELDKIDIKDATLLKVKSLIESAPNSNEEFNEILNLLRGFAETNGFNDVVPIIDSISDIDIDKINDLEYREENRKHLQKILVELKDMRDYATMDNIVGWTLLTFLILAVLFMVYLHLDLRYNNLSK